jgi:archaellum component FlaC
MFGLDSILGMGGMNPLSMFMGGGMGMNFGMSLLQEVIGVLKEVVGLLKQEMQNSQAQNAANGQTGQSGQLDEVIQKLKDIDQQLKKLTGGQEGHHGRKSDLEQKVADLSEQVSQLQQQVEQLAGKKEGCCGGDQQSGNVEAVLQKLEGTIQQISTLLESMGGNQAVSCCGGAEAYV